jgi:alkylated DNA repair dioxygenase AlkB
MKIKNIIEEQLNQTFNHCLLQWYRSGRDFIGEHSDKTLDISKDSVVVNISLGATRTMILKSKEKLSKDNDKLSNGKLNKSMINKATQKISLPHNSMFVLGIYLSK